MEFRRLLPPDALAAGCRTQPANEPARRHRFASGLQYQMAADNPSALLREIS